MLTGSVNTKNDFLIYNNINSKIVQVKMYIARTTVLICNMYTDMQVILSYN